MEHIRINPVNLTSTKPSPKSDPVWVLERAELLMSSFHKADYNNVQGFIATLGAILEQYPPEIVEYVTDPLTGIQRRQKYRLQPVDVVEACVAEIAHREKVQRYSNLPPPLPQLPRPKFSVDESYDAMTKKHGRPFGVFEAGRQLTYRG